MEAAKKRLLTRLRKKTHVRKKIEGDSNRPRVSVFRSSKHIYVQAIDDVAGKTLASASSVEKGVKDQLSGCTGNKEAASVAGKVFGEKLKGLGVESVVFDRNGYLYHGRIASLADGIREAGIKF